ncbi:MAG: flotillin-like FloA family protein, partial [Planctomycetota bacterium]
LGLGEDHDGAVEVPKAMAEEFRSGNLGIMDYYKMKNIQADTSMRSSLGDDGRTKS